jgi:hypothetical protein
MPHGTPPEFELGPPAPEASILTTRLWLTCKNGFPKKFIHDIPMVRVSSSIFEIISLFQIMILLRDEMDWSISIK